MCDATEIDYGLGCYMNWKSFANVRSHNYSGNSLTAIRQININNGFKEEI